MTAIDEFVAQEAAKDEDARADLRRIEEEITAEAEAAVEDYDAMGREGDAAAAAETAFVFEEAAQA